MFNSYVKLPEANFIGNLGVDRFFFRFHRFSSECLLCKTQITQSISASKPQKKTYLRPIGSHPAIGKAIGNMPIIWDIGKSSIENIGTSGRKRLEIYPIDEGYDWWIFQPQIGGDAIFYTPAISVGCRCTT